MNLTSNELKGILSNFAQELNQKGAGSATIPIKEYNLLREYKNDFQDLAERINSCEKMIRLVLDDKNFDVSKYPNNILYQVYCELSK